jgi:hypothetical protein
MSAVRQRRAIVAGLTLWVAAFHAPALAQESRQTDVTVGYLRVSCMNGVNTQFASERTRRLALVGEFNAAFGPDCGESEPRYRDFGILGGVRVSWYPGTRTTVFVQGLGGVLHSTAGAYSWEYESSAGGLVQVTEPELTIDYLALQPGAGVTMMLTPRLGLRAQADLQFAIPDQSEWEGVAGFPRATMGAVVRLGSPFTPRPQ